jgi:hypothetical protein
VRFCWVASNLTWATLGSWTLKEGIVFTGVSVTDHGLQLLGYDAADQDRSYWERAAVRSAEYTFSIATTMGILGVLNQYTSYIGGTFATSVNQAFGYQILMGPTNPVTRINQDNALVVGNLVQQTFRGMYLIGLGEFGGDIVSTWLKDTEWLAAAPDAAIATFLVGSSWQLYVAQRDGGLTYGDLKEITTSYGQSLKENVLMKAGWETNRIPAALEHEFMGEWLLGLPVISIEASQALSYSLMKDYDAPVAAKIILCGFLYGYASAVRAGTRNAARRTDEQSRKALEERIKSTRPGSFERLDATREFVRHLRDTRAGILRSRRLPQLFLSILYPAVEVLATQAIVSDAVMHHDHALENMFAGYNGYTPEQSSWEMFGRCVPGVLVGGAMFAFQHFLIPSKFPVLVDRPDDANDPRAGMRDANISPAEAYAQTVDIAVGMGAANAFANGGFYAAMTSVGLSWVSMMLKTSVLTKKTPTITPDEMPPDPEQVEMPPQPRRDWCCFRGLNNLRRMKEQFGNFANGLRGRKPGPFDGVVIHAVQPANAANAAQPAQTPSNPVNGHLRVLTDPDDRDEDSFDQAIDGLRKLIWDDPDQRGQLGIYLGAYATSGPGTDIVVTAFRYAAILDKIREFGQKYVGDLRDFVEEMREIVERSLQDLGPLRKDELKPDQLALIDSGYKPRVVDAPRPSIDRRLRLSALLQVLTRPMANPREFEDAIRRLQDEYQPAELEQLERDVRAEMSSGPAAGAAGARYAAMRRNVDVVWPVGVVAPPLLDRLRRIASSLQAPASAAVDVPRRPGFPLTQPMPMQSVFESAKVLQLSRVLDGSADMNTQRVVFSHDGESAEVYRLPGSIRAYLRKSARLVIFDLTSDESGVASISGVPPVDRADLEMLIKMKLLKPDCFDNFLKGFPPSAGEHGLDGDNPRFREEGGSADFNFDQRSGLPSFIRTGPAGIRIARFSQLAQNPTDANVYAFWDIDARNIPLLREALSTLDERYRDATQAQLAETVSRTLSASDLVAFLHHECVPMRQGMHVYAT